jgi:oligoendopeptidase F
MGEESFVQTRWSLKDLLPATAGPEFDSVLSSLESALAGLEAARNALSPDLPAAEFAALVARFEQIRALSSRLGAYGNLWFSGDTQDQEALAYRGRIDSLLADADNRTLFFTLWWKGLDEAAAARLLPAAGDSAYFLESLRRFKPHTLTEPEEKVVNLKNVNGVDALVTVYDMITSGFTYHLDMDGEVKELTRGQLMTYVRGPRPELRAAAYQKLYRVFGAQSTVLGQIYQHVVRDWASENMKLRHFSSPLAVRNLRNDIPDGVVDTLLEVCRRNAPVFQRYFRLKAGWLGMRRLRRYDIYAPLSDTGRTYPYQAAVELALGSMEAFSPLLAGHARRVLAEGHLDSEVRPRKDTGAFCSSPLPGLTPWVLMSYNGTSSDVGTLAHELGHAVHSLMAAGHSPLTFHSSLPLAETASTFAEMLLLDRMLAEEADPAVRRALLAESVDDAYATIQRQAFFVLFERDAHALVEEGQTTGTLAERYRANLAEQFGDALEIADEFRWEWVSIPHIYQVPFYCYAYSFGQLLVLSLYRQYEEEGAAFVPRYLKILAYGGSRSPASILEEAGIEIASPAFWQGGFDVIRDRIGELEGLA